MTRDTDADDRTDGNRLAGLAGLGATATRDGGARGRTAERIRRAGSIDESDPHARDHSADGGEGIGRTVDGGDVFDRALAVSSTYKVLGEIDAPDGAGVVGHNTATSGAAYGVEGVTEAGVIGAGVRAEASNGSADALAAETATGGRAVLGRATSGATTAIAGYQQDSSISSGTGVFGFASGDSANGVYGQSFNDTGTTVGVRGEVSSPAGYGVYSDGDSKTDGNHEVTGNLTVSGSESIGNVGVSAKLTDGGQVISNATETTVVFDATDRDDFGGGFDTSTGIYTVKVDGDYHVDFMIDWHDAFGSGTFIDHNLKTNGNFFDGLAATVEVNDNSQNVTRSYGKTLFDLSVNDTIEVTVEQDSGSDKELLGNANGIATHMTIVKVG